MGEKTPPKYSLGFQPPNTPNMYECTHIYPRFLEYTLTFHKGKFGGREREREREIERERECV